MTLVYSSLPSKPYDTSFSIVASTLFSSAHSPNTPLIAWLRESLRRTRGSRGEWRWLPIKPGHLLRPPCVDQLQVPARSRTTSLTSSSNSVKTDELWNWCLLIHLVLLHYIYGVLNFLHLKNVNHGWYHKRLDNEKKYEWPTHLRKPIESDGWLLGLLGKCHHRVLPPLQIFQKILHPCPYQHNNNRLR